MQPQGQKITFVCLLKPFVGLVVCASTLAGCSSNDLPVYIKLSTLRVLALKADKPESYPSDTVVVTPIISDVNGSGRALTYTAEACVDPGVSYGAEPTCTGNPTRTILASGAAASAPSGLAATGTTTSVSLTIPSTILVGRTSTEIFNGVNYLFYYKITAADGESVSAIKRLSVVASSKTSLNTNPGSTGTLDILFNGVSSASLTSLPSSAQTLKLSFTSSDQESYQYIKSDGTTVTRLEQLTTTWFISDGEDKTYRTVNDAESSWTPPGSAPSGRSSVVVGITRDDRGGVAMSKKEF